MPEKLDPRLLDAVERVETRSAGERRAPGAADAGPEAVVDVIVALDRPLDAAMRRELLDRGLRVRSEIGDVVTGSLALRDARNVAASPHVRVVEASGPLYPDDGDADGGPSDRVDDVSFDVSFDEGGGG